MKRAAIREEHKRAAMVIVLHVRLYGTRSEIPRRRKRGPANQRFMKELLASMEALA